MKPELDADGPAAPPRTNGEMVFTAPWQRRVFATTMAACDRGLVDYEQFRDRYVHQPTLMPGQRSRPSKALGHEAALGDGPASEAEACISLGTEAVLVRRLGVLGLVAGRFDPRDSIAR